MKLPTLPMEIVGSWGVWESLITKSAMAQNLMSYLLPLTAPFTLSCNIHSEEIQ